MRQIPKCVGRSIALLFLSNAVFFFCSHEVQANEATVILDPYSVRARINTLAFPYQQLYELSHEGETTAFSISEYTILKHHNSKFEQPIRHILRDADGRGRIELQSTAGIHAIKSNYREYIASSNQPAQFSDFYFLFRANCLRDGSGVNWQTTKRLFIDYRNFIERRIAYARKYYEAKKQDDFALLQSQTEPDEIVIVLHDEKVASNLALSLHLENQGPAVRLPWKMLNEKDDKKAVDPLAMIPISAINCISPWRSTEALPEVLDGAALLVVGWIGYRPHLFARARNELIILGEVSRR